MSVAFLLSVVGRTVREQVEEVLRDQGLSLRLLSALGHLARDPGLSYSELARRAGITVQSMQATLRQLEDAGAVRRETPAGRGRTAELHLTDEGRRRLGAGRRAIAGLDDDLLAGLDPAQRGDLARNLLRLATRPGR